MKKSSLIFILIFITTHFYAQTTVTYNGSGNYILIEKTDLRRYDNGRYTGLVSREISSYISPVEYDDGYLYEGNFYVWQDTIRNNVSLTGSVNDVILSKFKIDSDGQLTMIKDYGYPSFRSFPSFSKNQIQIGDKWQVKAERAVDPLGKGIVTKMPIYVEYQYTGNTQYGGEDCYVFSAQWATRYGMGSGNYYIDWGGDKDLEKAFGTNKAIIYVSKESGNALLIQDTVDETYVYKDGNQIQFKGKVSQFTEYPPAVDRSKIIPILKRIAEISPELEQDLKERDKVAKLDANLDEKGKMDGSNLDVKGNLDDANLDEKGNLDVSNTDSAKQDVNSKKKEIAKLDNENIDGLQNLVSIEETTTGITLRIEDLQFVADSSELLANENERLDKIAEVLRMVLNEAGEVKFLIEGHTASTGNEKGEMQLSLDRSHSIAEALVKRGVPANSIICKGSGGTKPIADNNTPQGKARNRRVEITILE